MQWLPGLLVTIMSENMVFMMQMVVLLSFQKQKSLKSI
ncbi:hypothetical protein BvCmsNSP058_04776 [Escherichia coli]|nr:hypothetical protein BvCmsKKP044_04743 [Escherichia coli]GEI20164.1 hypothetical protein EC161867_01446 [Escherichia coli O145:H25]GDH03196.1 hypothetical protein BvCmsKKP060_02898 [Escherichia coli]GDH26893.1 hypothetical protein BvCmsKKP038_01293 [Escherichia coli]GDH73749.1 hypothetical protein BvCmsKKP049_01598 [Escherichia coli]